MRIVLILLTVMMCCTSCTALPAEERAFAVVLCVEKQNGIWQLYGRIPAYKTSGEYMTVQGRGTTIKVALADLDAHAPMKVTMSQLRLLVISNDADAEEVFRKMADNPDVRMQCMTAVTEEPAEQIMEVLVPQTGSRLSKMLDLLIESRVEQGVIPDTRLADAVLMGERQSPVMAHAELLDGRLDLSSAWAAGERLTTEEMVLLSMLTGQCKEVSLNLQEGTVQIYEVKSTTTIREEGRAAWVSLCGKTKGSASAPDELERTLAESILTLLTRLSQSGCDALGLGRKLICYAADMPQWHEWDWPGRYRNIRWEIGVGLTGPA